MNNIANINNKPLKCVITNNKNAIKYFSNYGTGKEAYAGTLIVLDKQPDVSEPNGYREIYLNEKFLAGGYGFSTEQLVNTLTIIAKEYENTINRINNEETKNNYILTQLINTKLDKDGANANASNVYFEYDDSRKIHKLHIRDIIELLSKTPQYKDLEITSIKVAGEYLYYNGESKDLSGKNYNGELTYYDIDSFTLPINAPLKFISIKLCCNYNHSGGINTINIYYYLNSDESTVQKTDEYYINNSENKSSGEISFKLLFPENERYIIAEENNIIQKIDLNILATPQEKYQSIKLENNENSNIIYTANIIPEHIETIELPIIKGSYYLISYTHRRTISVESSENLNINTDLNNQQYEKIISNNSNGSNFTFISLDKQANEYIDKIIVILPYKFSIRQAYLVNNSDEISITNFLNYFKFSNDNIIQNGLKSSLYYIYISNGLQKDYKLKLDIIEDEDITYNDMNTENSDIIEVNPSEKIQIINSNEMHKYWINESNIDDFYNTFDNYNYHEL